MSEHEKNFEDDFKVDLKALSKTELVDYIHNYWVGLRKESSKMRKDDANYLQAEFGAVLFTQSNKMKNSLSAKLKSKKKGDYK